MKRRKEGNVKKILKDLWETLMTISELHQIGKQK
jgi:hypothetical protein